MVRPPRPLHAWAVAAARPQERRRRPGGGHLLEHEMAGQHRHRRVTCQAAHHTGRVNTEMVILLQETRWDPATAA
eukprot:6055421-Lingulodinium_polyedra.AAC.1